MDKFKQLILEFTQEWIDKQGHVTCEFSLEEKDLVEVLIFLSSQSEILSEYKGCWLVRWCETCRDHDASAPFHAEIVRIRI